MAYWWVSQGQSFKHERDGGYLWAPKANADGQSWFHWRNMALVRAGDLIVSYVDQRFPAIAIARGDAYTSDRPSELDFSEWNRDGWRVDVTYFDIEPAYPLANVLEDLHPKLPEKYSPLTSGGSGNQGYLYALPGAAGGLLCDRLSWSGEHDGDRPLQAAIASTAPSTTERDALVKSRIGQGQFRKDVLSFWDGKCAVTGCNLTKLLRASHIKPWRDSNNRERLDPFNGLLLTPGYDAAFDAGLVSFSDTGDILFCDGVDVAQLGAIGVQQGVRLREIGDEMRSYLEYHRDQVLGQ